MSACSRSCAQCSVWFSLPNGSSSCQLGSDGLARQNRVSLVNERAVV